VVSDVLDDLDVLDAAPRTIAVPSGRGLWRFTLHRRDFTGSQTWQQTVLAELTRARTRKLTQAWDAPSQLSFVVDGAAPEAAFIQELQHDVVAWRWDTQTGADVPVFHGVVSASEDDLDEQSHVVTFTCTDYVGMLARRYLTQGLTISGVGSDQDNIVGGLLTSATSGMQTTGGTSLAPGSNLAIVKGSANPDGTVRMTLSGNVLTRTYQPQQSIGVALDELAKCAGGFDYAAVPGQGGWGVAARSTLWVYYPQQGVVRADNALVYGANLSQVRRQVSSDDYANYWRTIGNKQSASASTAQLTADAWNSDAFGTVVGLWQNVDTGNNDVIDLPTLQQRVAGDLNRFGVLIPVYTLTLRPNTWYLTTSGGVPTGFLNMGDTVQLVINHGRLNVNTWVRVMGIEYDVGDDGNEDVALIVGRPDKTLVHTLVKSRADVEALSRR